MIVTPEEAQHKLCPQHDTTCHVSACMAWVEQFDSVQTNGTWQRIPSGLGFCGMVYKVSPKA